MVASKIRVLIVDDSALVRKVLVEILGSDPAIEIAGVANDPLDARDKIKALNPDVLTLDVEMPKMDGVTFLSNLMRLRPMPVVMVSSLTEPGAEITLAALELGAVDFVSKPKVDVAHGLETYAEELILKVKTAAKSRPRVSAPAKPRELAKVGGGGASQIMARISATDKLLAIGASTGGTEAVRELLAAMPPDGPPTVITQHIHASFIKPLAARLDRNSAMRVTEATDGKQIVPGHCYLAPGDSHLQVRRNGHQYICRLIDGDRVNGHKPSVGVLFDSVAEQVGVNGLAVLLTGMGKDGAEAMKRVRDAGGTTIAQDEATSVVWGMPGAAVKIGAASEVLPLGQIAPRLVSLLSK
ncbi:MAG: protein-glutamate methylesterase/protein-glutamine glutaminase [Acidimicrobiales bacterium]